MEIRDGLMTQEHPREDKKMIDYRDMPQNQILCVDMKSFYASCSAVMLGLDPLECYLAVVGNTDRTGSVVLAASPRLKKDFGIKTGSRMFEIPEDPRIRIVDHRNLQSIQPLCPKRSDSYLQC
jgi:hypothetical protein